MTWWRKIKKASQQRRIRDYLIMEITYKKFLEVIVAVKNNCDGQNTLEVEVGIPFHIAVFCRVVIVTVV